jgi:hypothetical protein
MRRFQLRGKTLKGKNRVREHGPIWLEAEAHPVVDVGRRVFVVAATDSLEARWIDPLNDRDFHVTTL